MRKRFATAILCLLLGLSAIFSASLYARGPGSTAVSISDEDVSFSAGAIQFTWNDTGTGGSFPGSYVGTVELYAWNAGTSEWDELGSGQDTTSDDYYEAWTVEPDSETSRGLNINVAGYGLTSDYIYAAQIYLFSGTYSGYNPTPIGSVVTQFVYGGDPVPPDDDPLPVPEPPLPPIPPGDGPPPIEDPLGPPSGPAGPGSFATYKFSP